jgi:hypothetical protein
MLMLGVLFFFQKTVKPIASLVLVLGAFALAAGAFAFGDDGTAASSIEARVRILSPQTGGQVPAGEPFPVRVELTGGTLTSGVETGDPTAGHLHVFVDEELVAMPSNDTPEVQLTPGEHTIAVEFTSADHRSFEPRIIDDVRVTAQ